MEIKSTVGKSAKIFAFSTRPSNITGGTYQAHEETATSSLNKVDYKLIESAK